MRVYRLDERLLFPPPEGGPRRGPIAIGGDLRPERLLLAYSMGIFPGRASRSTGTRPIRAWCCSRTSCVTRSLRQAQRLNPFRLTLDTAFAAVMTACASVPRPGQEAPGSRRR
jgi:leucyl/phenylalanyl-tRNA--protein transferase